jgi:hypothetical protein
MSFNVHLVLLRDKLSLHARGELDTCRNGRAAAGRKRRSRAQIGLVCLVKDQNTLLLRIIMLVMMKQYMSQTGYRIACWIRE